MKEILNGIRECVYKGLSHGVVNQAVQNKDHNTLKYQDKYSALGLSAQG